MPSFDPALEITAPDILVDGPDPNPWTWRPDFLPDSTSPMTNAAGDASDPFKRPRVLFQPTSPTALASAFQILCNGIRHGYVWSTCHVRRPSRSHPSSKYENLVIDLPLGNIGPNQLAKTSLFTILHFLQTIIL